MTNEKLREVVKASFVVTMGRKLALLSSDEIDKIVDEMTKAVSVLIANPKVKDEDAVDLIVGSKAQAVKRQKK